VKAANACEGSAAQQTVAVRRLLKTAKKFLMRPLPLQALFLKGACSEHNLETQMCQ
jgi:hypothetical protein